MSNQKLKILAEYQTKSLYLPANCLLFYLKNGKNILRTEWYQMESSSSPFEEDYFTLLLGKTPLVYVQSSGCPTCESLLAAGYGIPEDQNELKETCNQINLPYTTLADALERISPLIFLLPTGFYLLSMSDYYPTDGNGHFFWKAVNQFTPLSATAEYYESRNYRCLDCPPAFLYPSQPHSKFDPDRVEYYRHIIRENRPFPHAIAHSLMGAVSVLLDGHHRAAAAALEGKMLPTLTISEPLVSWKGMLPTLYWPDGEAIQVSISTEQSSCLRSGVFGKRKKRALSPEEGKLFFSDWGKEFDESASRYPTYQEATALSVYNSRDYSQEKISKLLQHEYADETDIVSRLIFYFSRQKGIDLKVLAFGFTAKYYPNELREIAFRILDTMKSDPEVDDFFVQFLIDTEDKKSVLYMIADHHWDKC